MQLDRDRLRDLVAAEPAISGAWLFGSQASGRAGPGSDVDVAIRARSGVPLSAMATMAVCGRVAIEMGADAHLVDLANAPLALRVQVMRYGIELFDHDRGRTRATAVQDLIAWWDEAPFREVQRRALDGRLARLGHHDG